MRKLFSILAVWALMTVIAMAETAEFAPPGYVSGCKLVYVGTNTITITSGKLANSTDSQYMTLPTNVLVDVGASGDNGLDTGTETSNLWYAVFVAIASDLSVVGVLSTNMAGPTGYTIFRVVGCIRNDGSKDILPFIQRWAGLTRLYQWDATVSQTRALLNGSSTTNTVIDLSQWVPPTASSVMLQISFESGLSGSDNDNLKIMADGLNNSTLKLSAGVVSDEKIIVNGDVATSATQKIIYRVDNSNNKASIIVKGFYDEL